MSYTIIWDNEAKKQLKEIIQNIRKDYPQNADLVKKAILTFIPSLQTNPNRCANLHNSKKINIKFHIVKNIRIVFEVINTKFTLQQSLKLKK